MPLLEPKPELPAELPLPSPLRQTNFSVELAEAQKYMAMLENLEHRAAVVLPAFAPAAEEADGAALVRRLSRGVDGTWRLFSACLGHGLASLGSGAAMGDGASGTRIDGTDAVFFWY